MCDEEKRPRGYERRVGTEREERYMRVVEDVEKKGPPPPPPPFDGFYLERSFVKTRERDAAAAAAAACSAAAAAASLNACLRT